MKILLALFLTLPLAAHPAEPKPEEAKPAVEERKAEAAAPAVEERKAEAAAPAVEERKAEAAAPAAEENVSGSIEFGYRFVGDVRGSRETYRSLVDLERGPRVFGVDFTMQNPGDESLKHLFDRVDLTAAGWGGEPHSSIRVNARRSGAYRLFADYRNLAYYNFLPSFADPTIARGTFLNQRAFDTNRRYINVDLELWPDGRKLGKGWSIIPYLGYSHDSSFGTGVTPYVSDGNEYPVWNRLRDKTDLYRGGVRAEKSSFHVTLEQGATKFKDDQFVGTADRNFGNRTTPLLGRRLVLDNLSQAYGVRGDSIYSKVLLTDERELRKDELWLDVHGEFLYSRPSSDVKYSNDARGLFALLGAARFFNGQYDALSAESKQPHSSGSAGFELRWVGKGGHKRKLRIIETILTDRFHNASSAVLAEQLFFGTAATAGEQLSVTSLGRMVYNFNRQQVDVIADVAPELSLRGGHRYEWGDAQVRSGALDLRGREAGELKRQIGLAGFSLRPMRKLSLTMDYEAGVGDRSYFRTSLYNYRKIRARARYQLKKSLLAAANFTVLANRNPTAGVTYDFQSRSNSLSIQWTPRDGKWVSLLGEYGRSTLSSDLSYVDPLDRARERSFYRDNAHVASGLMDINLPVGGEKGKITLGGSMFLSHGNRPTDYYQPMGRIELPIVKHFQWFGEWRWYGYSEPFYLYEGFRSHLFLTGLRLSL